MAYKGAGSVSFPTASATPNNIDDSASAEGEKTAPAPSVFAAMQAHVDAIHKHLKAAHNAGHPNVIRHHINQAGMAVGALHKTAQAAATTAGHTPAEGESASYAPETNNGYAGQ